MSLFATVLVLYALGGLGQQIRTPDFAPYRWAKGETFSGMTSPATTNAVLITGGWSYTCPTSPTPKRTKKSHKVSPLILALTWTAGIPKLGPTAYKGDYGWHETRRDGKLDLGRTQIHEAIAECRMHNWRGYVQWTSAFGHEVDSCIFMKLVAARNTSK